MVNYLARGDLNGARVEARRFAVMQKFIAEHESHGKALSGPGSYLAGFIFEKSNQPGEALRYYDEALAVRHLPVARRARAAAVAARQLHARRALTRAARAARQRAAPPRRRTSAELLVIVNYGRVPAKIAQARPDRPRADARVRVHEPAQRVARQPPRGAGPRDLGQLPEPGQAARRSTASRVLRSTTGRFRSRACSRSTSRRSAPGRRPRARSSRPRSRA